MKKRFLTAVLVLFLIYVVFNFFRLTIFTSTGWFPNVITYITFSNVMGGCFDVCEGKEIRLLCRENPDDLTDSFATCVWLCLGKHFNTCRR